MHFTNNPKSSMLNSELFKVNNRMNTVSFSMNSTKHLRGCRIMIFFSPFFSFFFFQEGLLNMPALLLNTSSIAVVRALIWWF